MRAIATRWRGLSAPLLAKRVPMAWNATRLYSAAAGAGMDPSKLVLEKTEKPSALKKPEDLVFGNTFTGTTASPPFHWAAR